MRRLVLSGFLVFHLLAVFTAPNLDQRGIDPLREWIEKYVSVFEFANRWSFFAPDPGPPTLYVDAEYFGISDQKLGEQSYPEPREHFWLTDRWARRMASTEYLIYSPVRVERVLKPYFCRQRPDAHSVVLYRRWRPTPSLAEIKVRLQSSIPPSSFNREFLFRGFCTP